MIWYKAALVPVTIKVQYDAENVESNTNGQPA